MKQDEFISVVIPVYNSQTTMSELYSRLTAVMTGLCGTEGYELVFVDDASSHDCWSLLDDLTKADRRVNALQLMKNSGQGVATIAGLDLAKGTLIVTIDDDLQHPPEAIPLLVSELVKHPELDVVIGVPRAYRQVLFRRAGSWLVNLINSVLLRKPLDLRFSAFRAMRSEVAKALTPVRLPAPALGPLIFQVTSRIRNIEFEHDRRPNSASRYSFAALLRQTMGNLISFSMLPLQFLSVVGVLGIFTSASYFLFLFTQYLRPGTTVPGFTTLALLLIGVAGLCFFAFGLIGEYLIRILKSTASTPSFVVRIKTEGGDPTSASELEAQTYNERGSESSGALGRGESAGGIGNLQAAYYSNLLSLHGAGVDAVASGNIEYKRLRYERLCAVIGPEPEFSVHDVGFGLGHLRAYLHQRFPDQGVEWSGSEVTPEFVDHVRAIDPDAPIMLRDLADSAGEDRYDYLILAGTFYHLADANTNEFMSFMESLVRNCWKMCRNGLAFNVVTDIVDYRIDGLFYPEFGKVIEMVRSLTRFFEIDHATPLYEYTVRMYKPEVLENKYRNPLYSKYLRNSAPTTP